MGMTKYAFVALIYSQRNILIVIKQICKLRPKYLANF